MPAAADSSRSRGSTPTTSPALVKCGWGLERNRNGGNAALAVLALPAVGGKFGVRGGGYSMSNSASWGIKPHVAARRRAADARRQHEPRRPRAARADGHADPRAVRLQLQSGGDAARSAARAGRPRARGSLHRGLRSGAHRHGGLRRRRAAGHDVPRALRLRQGLRRAQSLQLARPVIEPVAESRPNADVFGDLAGAPRPGRDDDPADELEQMLRRDRRRCRQPSATSMRRARRRHAAASTAGRCSSWTSSRSTPDGKVALWPDAICGATRRTGLYAFMRRPGHRASIPLALISPAIERTISSTLGELERPARACSRCTPTTPRRAASRTATTCASSTRSASCECPREGHAAGAAGHGGVPQGRVAAAHRQRPDLERPGARHADRPGRRRVLQRRARRRSRARASNGALASTPPIRCSDAAACRARRGSPCRPCGRRRAPRPTTTRGRCPWHVPPGRPCWRSHAASRRTSTRNLGGLSVSRSRITSLGVLTYTWAVCVYQLGRELTIALCC